MNPNYPIYIISKGRGHKKPLTCRELDNMTVPYYLCVEPQEYADYAKVVDPRHIITLPFSDLGRGSIPVRNFVWEDSVNKGHKRHWVMDDNIEGFHRLNMNMKPKVTSGTIFKIAEGFVDRYTNIALAGFNYYSFCKATDAVPPYYLNTRIYSCILVNNELEFRWRGKYNEDTDLSLRALKGGWCTILFNAFLAGKVTTMRMRGGNTDDLYKDDGRRKMAQSLVDQHPDIVRIAWKFGRWQHAVNYKPFKGNALKRDPKVLVRDGVDNYNMRLI